MSKWHHPTKIRKKEILNCERKVKHINEISAISAMKEVADKGMLHVGAVPYECQRRMVSALGYFAAMTSWHTVLPEPPAPSAKDLTGFTLYANDASPESLQDARDWLAKNHLTPDDARLIQTKTVTLVIAKRTPEAWKSNSGS